MNTSVTETLATVSTPRWCADLLPEVSHELRHPGLHTIAAGLGKVDLDNKALALQLARQAGGHSQATVFGCQGKVPLSTVAYVNVQQHINKSDPRSLLADERLERSYVG